MHSICVTLTEKERANDWPEVTTVMIAGELVERPMSMYTGGTRLMEL